MTENGEQVVNTKQSVPTEIPAVNKNARRYGVCPNFGPVLAAIAAILFMVLAYFTCIEAANYDYLFIINLMKGMF